DAKVLGALDLLEQVRRDDPGLGGNAAPVETGAAQLVLLDHRGLEAELRGPDGGHVAAGAGADDDEIEVLGIGHGGLWSGTEMRPGDSTQQLWMPERQVRSGRPGPRNGPCSRPNLIWGGRLLQCAGGGPQVAQRRARSAPGAGRAVTGSARLRA